MPRSAVAMAGTNSRTPRHRSRCPRGSLLSTVASKRALLAAFEQVKRSKSGVKRGKGSRGSDDVTINDFESRLDVELRHIASRLRRREFLFSALRAVPIAKGDAAYRPILIPSVGDRVVQRAILNAIWPRIAPSVTFEHSHAFQPKKSGVKAAVHQLARSIRSGKSYVLQVDIIDFFSCIDSARLFSELESQLVDESLTWLLRQLQNWEINNLSTIPAYKRQCFPAPGKGVPQGSVLSPVLANFYLRQFDAEAAERGLTAIRYADDLAIPCSSREEANTAFAWMERNLAERGLRVHPLPSKKSRIVDVSHEGLEHLGFYLRVNGARLQVRPTKAAVDRARREIHDTLLAPKGGGDVPLMVRYAHLSFFLHGWISSYGAVCPIKRECEALSREVQAGLASLLTEYDLLRPEAGLTDPQRRFLGVDSVFAAISVART